MTKLLYGAAYRIKEINPYDYAYGSLGVELKRVDEEQDEFKMLTRYINNSIWQNVTNQGNYFGGQNESGVMLIQNIFSAEDKDQKKRGNKDADEFFKSIGNHVMLFHGTSNANVLSILEQGLQITPANSISSNGQAFGKGIYFADKASKSFNVSLIKFDFVVL